MALRCIIRVMAACFVVVAVSPTAAQIGSNAGDGRLNATYRGTINSLRQATMDVGYGETINHVEPVVSSWSIVGPDIKIWVVRPGIPPGMEPWDRSILRMYEGVDASGDEIDLTGTSEAEPATVLPGGLGFNRFSLRAMGTKTLAPQVFEIHFEYVTDDPNLPDHTATRTFTVTPTTGSFHDLPGESEAFHFGTPILDVSLGGARLTVPIGCKARMIGAPFMFKNQTLGPSEIQRTDVVLPGAAESVYLMNDFHFRLTGSSLGPFKGSFGTPWPGYLVGYHALADLFAPDGTEYWAGTPVDNFVRFNYLHPLGVEFSQATQQFEWTTINTLMVVSSIHDLGVPTNNTITLFRDSAAVVTRIETSDGRGWNIQADLLAGGWITGIVPDSGKGARYFKYHPDAFNDESPHFGRVTQVRLGEIGGDPYDPDVGDQIMYKFVYDADGDLREEWRYIDDQQPQQLQKAVEHVVVDEGLRLRREYTDTNLYRQLDFAYDTAATPPLNHRLKSITSYSGINGSGEAHTRTYTHMVGAPSDPPTQAGTMVVAQEVLPDNSVLTHEYDSHVGTQLINVGFRTKTTHSKNTLSLVTFDIDYEYFYSVSGSTRLFYKPRVVKQRNGRGPLSEVAFDYEDGDVDVPFDGAKGEITNQLRSSTGPNITMGTSGNRTPQTRYTYSLSHRRLIHQETDFAQGAYRAIDFSYDPLLRLSSTTVDPGIENENFTTQFLYCDASPTQDRITIVPDELGGYWTRTRFDNDGRVATIERFLDHSAGASACADPAGPFYKTTNMYDANGRLFQQIIDNKDQLGAPLSPATITTEFTYDRIGRLTKRVVDSAPGGIGSDSNFDYNWQGDVEREFDTSGRGIARLFEGRGLVASETPLAENETPDGNLTTTFTYDSLGNLQLTTLPTGAMVQNNYDDFERLQQSHRMPGPGGGNTITTNFEYDEANNVTRTYVEEGAGILSDSTAFFDEGNFNYESRQRLTAGSDGAGDPVTQRQFDWAGNVIEERSLGDATVGDGVNVDRVISTVYDGANRVQIVTDSQGGQTMFTRDQRGNVTEQSVKLNTGPDFAVTTTVYDALSRAVQISDPEDQAMGGDRHFRERTYDSRGNLLRETRRDASNVAKMTSVFAYDTAGRLTRQAVLDDATGFGVPPDIINDRVIDLEYDADGRLKFRTTYSNDDATSLVTSTTYDPLGRVDKVTDPSVSFTDDNYAANGRLSSRVVNDGLGSRTFTFNYDGHDRVVSQTALGPPDLVTTFTLDGLERQVAVTDPRGIITTTSYDLAGRRDQFVEDASGALRRQIDFTYNRLSQLIIQTAQNINYNGASLPDQVTHFRYDTLGRLLRTVFPDSNEAPSDPNCIDCVRAAYDLAGRMTQRIDQQALHTTDFVYDDRGLMLSRTTDMDPAPGVVDSFDYDALGRLTLAQRGTTNDPDAVSKSTLAYADIGDIDSENQTIGAGAQRTVAYTHDQAGNRLGMTYPSGVTLSLAPTAINQVDTIHLDGNLIVDYDYMGHLLDNRLITTTAAGGNTFYDYNVGYDPHRRISFIGNSFVPDGGPAQTLANYDFTHDDGGNPLSQTTTGVAGFAGDDRAYTVDSLNRLRQTQYTSALSESVVFDLVGNRHSHSITSNGATHYTLANAANEYATIDPDGFGSNPPIPVTYDAAGNLTVDEAGRQYLYDEQNRLIEVRDALSATLASFVYDALGRRISVTIGGGDTRYYYDGSSVIEERDDSDGRLRYHVNGAQYIDERVATYDDASGEFSYYILKDLFTVAGTGDAGGNVLLAFTYGAYGMPALISGSQLVYAHDADADGDVDHYDIASFLDCFGQAPPSQSCLDVHDFDDSGASDGVIDGDDLFGLGQCLSGPDVNPTSPGCVVTSIGSGIGNTFFLHGREVDVLPDGLVLQYNRARYYDLRHGRWLQRDPGGYADTQNLYEGFGSNPTRWADPYGSQSLDPQSRPFLIPQIVDTRHGFPDGRVPPADERWYSGPLLPPRRFTMRSFAQHVKQESQRLILYVFVDPSQIPPEQFGEVLGREFGATLEGVQLMGASINPLLRPALRERNPRLAEALTEEAILELTVLGPAQGGAFALEGAGNIVIDLANLGLRINELQNPVLLLNPELAPPSIPNLDVAEGMFLETSPEVAATSRFLGGESIVFLITAGVGSVASEGGAAVGAGARTFQPNPILETQREISLLANRQIRVVDRFLRISQSDVARAFRQAQQTDPHFAALIRGRVLDRRMLRFFRQRFRPSVPGIRIDQTIGTGSRLRPDLFFPSLGGRRVIFDVGTGLSKVRDITKYEEFADVIIPIIPVP